jgi:hypothetical protein
VHYVHGGSEFVQDAISFEIELSSSSGGSNSVLPKEMHVRQRFRLQISIRPLNDVPRIELGPELKGGRPLRIAEGTTKLLSQDLINVIDPDNTKAEIVVTLVPAGGNALPGHIENERFPGQARNSFTLEDLAQGRVSFVHQVHIRRFAENGAYAGCPITHGIHCKKSVKTKCQFKKRLEGKKSEIQCQQNFILSTFNPKLNISGV